MNGASKITKFNFGKTQEKLSAVELNIEFIMREFLEDRPVDSFDFFHKREYLKETIYDWVLQKILILKQALIPPIQAKPIEKRAA